MLAAASVRITDSSGGSRLAPLFFVSARQINYLVPEETSEGLALVAVETSGQQVASGTVRINPIAPALFAANASGEGPAAASFLRVASDGTRTEALTFDSETRAAVPIDLGPEGDQIFLLLFGTGFRGFTESVLAAVGGENVKVLVPCHKANSWASTRSTSAPCREASPVAAKSTSSSPPMANQPIR